MILQRRILAATAVSAALSLFAAPAFAADVRPAQQGTLSGGVVAPLAFDAEAEAAHNHRWRRYDRYHDRGIDGGDVLAGILILGAIAAIASASDSSDEPERYPTSYPDYPEPERQGYDYPGERTRGIDNAVSMCVGEVERGNDRVATVDGASRTTEGWQVNGALEDGQPFDCWIDNQGRIRNVDIGRYGAGLDESTLEDNQPDDEYYVQARARQFPAGG